MKIPPYEDFVPEIADLFQAMDSITTNNPAIAITLSNFKPQNDSTSLNGSIEHGKLIQLIELCDSFASYDIKDVLSKKWGESFRTQLVNTDIADILHK